MLDSATMLEDIDRTQIGRYGTISLLKRQDPSTVITAFGIDTQELTFGRDCDCAVRLYYPDVDPIHCKIVFEERKAFLVVLGKHGLLVDGCLVYPNPTANGTQTTIPLTNNSEIEIHNKRFRFTYPPKELRTMLFDSPIRPNRAPRLSMIRSAQVFSPRPSKNSEENLRVLRSPVKSNFLHSPLQHACDGKPRGSVTPTIQTFNHTPEHDFMETKEEYGDIVLVEGDRPRVFEEEKDLVILEDVEVRSMPSPSTLVVEPGLHAGYVMDFSTPNPPQTPRRRPSLGKSLHRAVLIRSAQRAVFKAEKEEDEVEEMEVLSVVASDDDMGEGERTQPKKWSPSVVNLEAIDEGSMDTDEEVTGEQSKLTQHMPLLQESSLTGGCAQSTYGEDDSEPLRIEVDGDAYDIRGHTNEFSVAHFASINRRNYLGDFITPQPRQKLQNSLRRNLFGLQGIGTAGDVHDGSEHLKYDSIDRVRYSIGGSEPGRMLVEMPWRVKDLVVTEQPHGIHANEVAHGIFSSESDLHIAQCPTLKSPKKLVDEQERKAIQERRRSALREADTFFIGGVPGMGVSPTKTVPTPCHRYPNSGLLDTPRRCHKSSQGEEDVVVLVPPPIAAVKEEEDDELDTKSLLEKMKVTVEEMKRRRSSVFTPSFRLENGESIVMDKTNPLEDVEREDALKDKAGKEQSFSPHPGARQEETLAAQDALIQTQRGLPAVVIDPPAEEKDCCIETSFSQLMRSESPQDLEQSSNDIRNILEQDITMPSEDPSQPHSLAANLHTAHRKTRSRSRTPSAEPETRPFATTVHNDTHSEMSGLVSDDGLTGKAGTGLVEGSIEPFAAESRGGRPARREKNATPNRQVLSGQEAASECIGQLEAEQDESKSIPRLASRVTRASRRGRPVASLANSRQRSAKGNVGRNEEEGPAEIVDDQSNAQKESRTRGGASTARGRPRKAGEEDRGTPAAAVARNNRTRSATVNGDSSAAPATVKTPATRSGGRRTPATAPTVIQAIDAQNKSEHCDKENSRSSKAMPEEGTRVRISRSRAAAPSTVASASKIAGRVKTEEVESDALRGTTRTRTRTRARAKT